MVIAATSQPLYIDSSLFFAALCAEHLTCTCKSFEWAQVSLRLTRLTFLSISRLDYSWLSEGE